MTHLIEVKASFHGHSPDSDGVSHKREYVEAARRAKIHFFGFSEHDFINLEAVRENYRLIEASNVKNPNGHQLIPVAAVEMTTADGEFILACPGEPLNEKFVKEANEIIENDPTKQRGHDVVRWAVEKHNGIWIAVHPLNLGISAPAMGLRYMFEFPKLVGESFKNGGLEAMNGSSSVVPVFNNLRESAVWRLGEVLGYRIFGFADFHAAYQVSEHYTEAWVSEVRAEGLVEAIQKNRIRPSDPIPEYNLMAKFQKWQRLVDLMGEAEIRYRHFRGKDL